MIQMNCPTHPGELMQDAWPEGISLTAAAKKLGIPRSTLISLVNGQVRISAELAEKLHGWCGINADMWLRMQTAHDQWLARHQPRTNDDTFQRAA